VGPVLLELELGVLLMARKPKVKGGDPAARAAASAQIEIITSIIDDLWESAAKIADKHGVSFRYDAPHSDTGGGMYYPKRPADWINLEEEQVYGDEDPNRDHPEHEDYHPWNDCNSMGNEYDWTSGNWISSSERC
jgi:hypothetical protein